MYILKDWHDTEWGSFREYEDAYEAMSQRALADMRDEGISTESWDDFDYYDYQQFLGEYYIDEHTD